MKIYQRNNGGWCMEHHGVEAPCQVVFHPENQTFTVYDLDDEERRHAIAEKVDKETAEILALQHWELI